MQEETSTAENHPTNQRMPHGRRLSLIVGALIVFSGLCIGILLSMRVEWMPYRISAKSDDGTMTEIAFAAPHNWYFRYALSDKRGVRITSPRIPRYVRWLQEQWPGVHFQPESDGVTAFIQCSVVQSNDPALPSHEFRILRSNNIRNVKLHPTTLRVTLVEHNSLDFPLPLSQGSTKLPDATGSENETNGKNTDIREKDAEGIPIVMDAELHDGRTHRVHHSIIVSRKHTVKSNPLNASYYYETYICDVSGLEGDYATFRPTIDAIIHSLHFVQ